MVAVEPAETGRRRGGGREGRRERRAGGSGQSAPAYITRQVPTYELLGEEGLSLIEAHAETLLQEIGLEFRGDPEVLRLWREAGAEVAGELVRFPRGLVPAIIRRSVKPLFTQHARNPARSVQMGGRHTVFSPAYGSPFVYDRAGGRRYGTLADFENFVKLAYASPWLHHSGGTICEPVDVPVNKRHLDMVYAHLKYSDKPIMGSVTAPERAEDTVALLKIVFGEDFVQNNTVCTSLINANSPMVWDDTMLGALKVYARNNQAVITTPFILSGAMSPCTVAGTMTQTLAEALCGMATAQLVRRGAPVILGSFASSMSMQSGAPTFGTPEPALVLYGMAALARRLGVPFRSGGSLCGSKAADAQAAYESAQTLIPTLLGGVNFVLHAAGWLEGGLVSSYEKFVLDTDQLGMMQTMAAGIDMSENGQAMDAIREVGPGKHFLGCAHTQKNFESAFYRSSIADNNSFEQWLAEGEQDATRRANTLFKKMLNEYEPPALDPGLDEALLEFIAKRKAGMPDAFA